MIDFRYHVVSIIAVFLALALGLFLGSTSLQDAVVHTLNSNVTRVTHENTALGKQVHDLQSQLTADRAFDKALLPYAVSGRLSGRQVSLISAPDASDAARKQVTAAIVSAGATLSADVRLQDAIVNPKQDAFLEALTERVDLPGHPNAANADGAKRAAAQLAAVLGIRPNSRAVAATSVETVLSAYATGKLLRVGNAATAPRPGDLAVVLTGPTPPPTADPVAVKAESDFLVELLNDLDQAALGAVLAAPTPRPGAGADGTVSAADALGVTAKASAVTGIDTSPGQIAMVFALAAQVDGISGRYDPTSSAASPFPTASGAP